MVMTCEYKYFDEEVEVEEKKQRLRRRRRRWAVFQSW